MIDSYSLMLGDWVCTPEGYRQIRQIFEEDGVYTKLVPTDGWEPEGFDFEEIEPIPLTPKILEKNGFKDEGYFSALNIGIFQSNMFMNYNTLYDFVELKNLLNYEQRRTLCP